MMYKITWYTRTGRELSRMFKRLSDAQHAADMIFKTTGVVAIEKVAPTKGANRERTTHRKQVLPKRQTSRGRQNRD